MRLKSSSASRVSKNVISCCILNSDMRQLAKLAMFSEVVVHHNQSDRPFGFSEELSNFAIRYRNPRIFCVAH